MNRQLAIQSLRDLLDKEGLKDWHVRLITDLTKPFVGLCSYKDHSIILNAHHVDTHPDPEILNTIRHEVAHALVGIGHGHNDVWAQKARELGCDNTLPCMTYALSQEAIDAIKSGAELKVEFTEETHVVRKPKYTISRIQDKCATCGKVAKVKSQKEVKTSKGHMIVVILECNHVIFKEADSTSPFETLAFDGLPTCKHVWGLGKSRTICQKCNAKRLYEYQVAGSRSLERANGRLAIFDEMGLGKTIQALAYLKFHPENSPFLWITRSGIKFQHAKEIIRILGKSAFPQVLMTGKDTLIPGMSCIASYDIFKRMSLEMFQKHGFQTVILDECQAIKNPDSSRTQSIRQVVKVIPKVIPLSGTPWKNRGSEFFVVLNMLDPKLFWSYEQFKRDWVEVYWDQNKQKEGGIKNPEKFREYISHLAIRRERVEVMPELPLINRTKLLSEVPEYARQAYNKEHNHLVDILNAAAIDGTEDTFETKKQAMQSLMVMRQIVGLAKVPTTVEFAKEFLEDTDRKMVIFVHHVACGEMILKQLQEHCLEEKLPQPLQLNATMDGIMRAEVADKFNSPNYRLLIASTLASGEGLNLQSCSDCIMHERQWNPANEEQAEGRFIRIGQLAQSVNATYVHGDATVDPILDGIVEGKRVNFHNTMNKGTMPTWNEASVVSELLDTIRKQGKR